jgi:hypothetical protein
VDKLDRLPLLHASKIFRHSGITVAFKTTFAVFTRASPDNSLERLTDYSHCAQTVRIGRLRRLRSSGRNSIGLRRPRADRGERVCLANFRA